MRNESIVSKPQQKDNEKVLTRKILSYPPSKWKIHEKLNGAYSLIYPSSDKIDIYLIGNYNTRKKLVRIGLFIQPIEGEEEFIVFDNSEEKEGKDKIYKLFENIVKYQEEEQEKNRDKTIQNAIDLLK